MTGSTRWDAEELLRHAGFVRAMARGVLGSDDRVDDAVQDTWVAALERREAPAGWRSWLASVGRRRAGDIARREARRRRHEEGAARPEAAPSVEGLVERAEVTQRLVAALLALDEVDRDVLLLRYWEGLPPRDVAARLGVPVETARTRTKRALERLRSRMDAGHGGDRRRWSVALAAWAGTPDAPAPASPGPAVATTTASMVALGGLAAVVVVVFAVSDDARRADVPSAPSEVASSGDGARAPALAGAPAPAKPRGDGPAPAARSAEGIVVSGSVRDARGAPVAGIPVRYSLTPLDGAHPGPAESYTDATGRYRIEELRPGRLWMNLLSERGFEPSLEIEHDLRADWTHDFTSNGSIVLAGTVDAPGTKTLELSLDYREENAGGGWGNNFGVRRVSFPAGERAFRFAAMHPGVYTLNVEGPGVATVRRELRLFADTTDLVVRARAAAEAVGRVAVAPPLDPAGSRLWVTPAEGADAENVDVEPDGTFRLFGFSEGRHVLAVRNRTVMADEAVLTERAFDVTLPVRGGRFQVDVVPDEEVGLRVALPDGVDEVRGEVRVIGGKGWRDAVTAFVVRRDGGEARILPPTPSREFPPPVRTLTRDGALRVPGMPKGTYVLRVTAPGHVPVERQVRVDGPTTVEVDLAPSAGGERIVRADVPDEYWSVDARPDGGAWRRILWRDDRVRISHTPTPGDVVARLAPGRWEFRVVSVSHAPASLGPIDVEPSAEPLVLRFPLVPGASLSGRLVGKTGGPLSLLLHVFERQPDGSWRRLEEKETKAADGAYRVEGLAPGRYRVSPSEDGEPVIGEVDVDSRSRTLDLALR